MAVQPKHWLVRKAGAASKYGESGQYQCVVIADTEGDALAQASAILGVDPKGLIATRFNSGAPVGR